MSNLIIENFKSAWVKISNGIYNLTDLEYYSLIIVRNMIEGYPYEFN